MSQEVGPALLGRDTTRALHKGAAPASDRKTLGKMEKNIQVEIKRDKPKNYSNEVSSWALN